MRKIIIFAYLCLPLFLFGQEHLQFMGHPITGDMKTFVSILKTDGFSSSLGYGWFRNMKTKYMIGDFWMFHNCDIVIRHPKKTKFITSVYIHPHNNFLLLNDLINALDRKYGLHQNQYSNADVNSLDYIWNMPEGSICIFATIVYGQSFDIIYRDWTEVNMINNSINGVDDNL